MVVRNGLALLLASGLLAGCRAASPVDGAAEYTLIAYAGQPLPAALPDAAGDTTFVLDGRLTVRDSRAVLRQHTRFVGPGQPAQDNTSVATWEFLVRGDSVRVPSRCTAPYATCLVSLIGTIDGALLSLKGDYIPRPAATLYVFLRTSE